MKLWLRTIISLIIYENRFWVSKFSMKRMNENKPNNMSCNGFLESKKKINEN